ncbi:MAG: IS1595 family transposase [Candidatus Caenarcaniphilales bacterium]|nr:IS1595 family transposase [Candidatus Caenarcaniphilales bacterium]
MANKIQKQRGISLIDFLENFDSEEKCERYLEKLKWGKGFSCSKCGGTEYYRSKTKTNRLFYRCKSRNCNHRNHLLVGTMFQATKLPLKKWFLAIYFMTQGKKGISTLDLMRKLNVKEDTARLMKLKIMAVMESREKTSQLENLIQIDDAYYGGKHEGKAGRGSENKQAFLAAVSTDEKGHSLKVKFATLKSFTKEGVANFAKKFLAKGSEIYSDALKAFNFFSESEDYEHQQTNMSKGNKKENHQKFNSINTLISNLKSFIGGIHHSVSSKYLNKYFAEFQYRFNRRFDLKALPERFFYTAVHYCEPSTLYNLKYQAA